MSKRQQPRTREAHQLTVVAAGVAVATTTGAELASGSLAGHQVAFVWTATFHRMRSHTDIHRASSNSMMPNDRSTIFRAEPNECDGQRAEEIQA